MDNMQFHSMKARSHRPSVLVAYSFAMHYRAGILRALANHPALHVTLAAGIPPRGGAGGVRALDKCELPSLDLVRTRKFLGWWWQPALVRRALFQPFDVVIVDPSVRVPSMWIIALGRRFRGKKTIFWGLGWTRPHGWVRTRIKNFAFRAADHFMTYGAESASRAVQSGYPGQRISAIGNSLADLATAQSVCRELPPPSPFVMTASVRLTSRKRLDLLIRAAGVLKKDGETRVILLGDGPERGALIKLAHECEVDLEMWGARYDDQTLSQMYRQAHLTVLPGHAGLTVIQSIMHGRPVVTHDNVDHHAAEWEAIKSPWVGSFFAEGDLDDLVRQIQGLRQRIVQNPDAVVRSCRQAYLSDWSPPVQADRIARVVEQVLDGGH